MKYDWICACCGQGFDSLPMAYGFEGPDNWLGLTALERQTRADLNADLCTIDGSERYVRGCLEIPVLDCPEHFEWGVWVSVSESSLKRILELWNVPSVGDEPPRFGWLSNWISGYPRAAAIKCHIHIRPGNLRPRIELEATSHPLAVEQRTGITLDRVKEIAARAGHH